MFGEGGEKARMHRRRTDKEQCSWFAAVAEGDFRLQKMRGASA